MMNTIRTCVLAALVAAAVLPACAVEMDLTGEDELAEDDIDVESSEIGSCGHLIPGWIFRRSVGQTWIAMRADASERNCRDQVYYWRVKRKDTGAIVVSGTDRLPRDFSVGGLVPGRRYCYEIGLMSEFGWMNTDTFCYSTADNPIYQPGAGF